MKIAVSNGLCSKHLRKKAIYGSSLAGKEIRSPGFPGEERVRNWNGQSEEVFICVPGHRHAIDGNKRWVRKAIIEYEKRNPPLRTGGADRLFIIDRTITGHARYGPLNILVVGRHSTLTSKCLKCESAFHWKRYGGRSPRRFCSAECYKDYRATGRPK